MLTTDHLILDAIAKQKTTYTGGNRYTALVYGKVPLEVAQALDAAIDDGVNNVAKGAGL